MTSRAWIYLILAAIVVNSVAGIAISYTNFIVKDPLSISSHSMINAALALLVAYIYSGAQPVLFLKNLGNKVPTSATF